MTAGRPRVTIVGLGPGGPEYVTQQTLDAIARVASPLPPHHTPSVGRRSCPAATSFDDIYESADTFADVYAEITERLVAAATEHGEVLYAVPGSPLVLERTVRRLRARRADRVHRAAGDVVPRRRLRPPRHRPGRGSACV